jgi:hypothetical protein
VLYHFAYALNAAGQKESAAKLVTALLNNPAPFDERDDAIKLQAELGGPPAPAATASAPAPAPAAK